MVCSHQWRLDQEKRTTFAPPSGRFGPSKCTLHVFRIDTVAHLLNHPQFVDIANYAAQKKSDRQLVAPASSECRDDRGDAQETMHMPKERACVPETQLLAAFTHMLHDARGDEFMVSVALVKLHNSVHLGNIYDSYEALKKDSTRCRLSSRIRRQAEIF